MNKSNSGNFQTWLNERFMRDMSKGFDEWSRMKQKCLHCTGFSSKGATAEQARHGLAICAPYSEEAGCKCYVMASNGLNCPKYEAVSDQVRVTRDKWMEGVK